MAIRCLAREGNESHLERANVSATGCVGRKVPTPDLAPLRVQLDSIICPAAGRLGLTGPAIGLLLLCYFCTGWWLLLRPMIQPRLPPSNVPASQTPAPRLPKKRQACWAAPNSMIGLRIRGSRVLTLRNTHPVTQSLSKILPSARKLGSQVCCRLYEWCEVENGPRCSHASSQIRQCSVGSILTSSGLVIRSGPSWRRERRFELWRRSHARNPNAARGAQNRDCTEMSPVAQSSSLELN